MNNFDKKYHIYELLNPGKGFNKIQTNSYITEGHERLIWPAYSFLITFVSLSIFLQVPYNKKSNSNKLFFSILGIVIIVFLHFVFINIARKNINLIFISYLNYILLLVFSYTLSTYSRSSFLRLGKI